MTTESGGTASPKSDGLRKSEGVIGAAEREVGRRLYRRIEDLIDAKPGTPEGDELAWLVNIVESVEEYGEEACASEALWPADYEVRRIMAMSDEEIIATTPDAERVAAEMRDIIGQALAKQQPEALSHPETGAHVAGAMEALAKRLDDMAHDRQAWADHPGIGGNKPQFANHLRGKRYGYSHAAQLIRAALASPPLSPPTSEGERADGEGSR